MNSDLFFHLQPLEPGGSARSTEVCLSEVKSNLLYWEPAHLELESDTSTRLSEDNRSNISEFIEKDTSKGTSSTLLIEGSAGVGKTSSQGVKHYIKTKVTRRYADVLLTFLEQNDLLSICENPLACSVVIKIFKDQGFRLPKTNTDFLCKVVSGLVEFYLDPEEKASLSSSIQLECLPESAQTAVDAMCKLAIQHLITGHKCTSLEDSQNFLSSFELNLSTTSLKDGFRFGLVAVETVSEASSTTQTAYKFLDQSILEFLAVLYLHKLPPQNQLFFLAKHAQNMLHNGFSKWLKFYYGLTGEDHMQHVNYNPTKLMISTVTDLLVYTLELSSNHEHRYTLIECLHEAQEPSLLRKLSTKHPEVLTFSVRVEDFALWKGAVSTLINKSGSSVWHVETNDKNERTVNRLKTLTPKVTIVSESGKSSDKDDTLVLSPKLDSSGMKKLYKQAGSSSLSSDTGKERAEKLNSFCCRAVRDILQRILPLYSKVKLKGDSSNVSYVSFLACECFKKSFEEFVTLCPLQPVHFLDVPPKKKFAAASPESLTDTERHNLEEHDGHAKEVVILLKPFLRKIQCIVPDTNEEFSVVISGEISSEEAQESLSTQLDEHEIADVRCVEDYVPHSDNTQIVAPCLPVVQKTNGKTQAALPSHTALPPVTVPSVAHVDPLIPKFDEGTTTHQIGLKPGTVLFTSVPDRPVVQKTNGKTQAALPCHTALRPVTVPSVAHVDPLIPKFDEGTTTHQIGLKPGTVLFTSVPDRIPSDRIHPIPNEQHLIRRGGNGYIYSENVSGMSMAIKKTSYRSKEYGIITKLRHKNVMPLLAFVWGPENPENKRRYTVFHYLPKLTGDLARMVTDKKELSMSEFRKSHRYNPRVMGVTTGNLKYILSQVLEGLRYMHTLHIAHRDVKASNVLLKFFCGCDTPLLCGCDVKYQVVLCDFDAAIELTAEDRIPPTPSTLARSHTLTPSQVQVVPVGTNGFRAPECSMSIIANSPEALSPPVTTKCDIYSFGILSLRLFISTETPHSQRAMAMMILHYQQKRKLKEGSIDKRRHNFLKVQQEDIDKLLKLPKLQSGVSWLKGAYDFVRQCVSSDPDQRPSANDLLKHPFLAGFPSL